MLNAELGDRRLVLTNYPLTASAAPFLAIPHFAIRNFLNDPAVSSAPARLHEDGGVSII
jgi:hypothetical protein